MSICVPGLDKAGRKCPLTGMVIQTLKAVSNRVFAQTTGKAKRLALAYWILSQAALGTTMALEASRDASPQEIFRARVFEEPLVPVGGEPAASENAALAAALREYSNRNGPDDFSALTGFLEKHPRSVWNAALLTDLGLEYYNTAHYSLAVDAWARAWTLAKDTTDIRGKAIADRAVGELAYMHSRLGRMEELERLLKSVEGRVFIGPATEKITGAREALWNMQHRPEISFRCGPLALHRIKLASGSTNTGSELVYNSASTQNGFSLSEVAELSKRLSLNYQMAFRGKGGSFVVPSVVHWKAGHYAAMVRQEGDAYLLEDPTFGNSVWATRTALEEETSGYFLIPPGELSRGWREVPDKEGQSVWGKGVTANNEAGNTGTGDPRIGGGSCQGMAVSAVHLMLVSLNLSDEPVGYTPPVGPEVRFIVRYNQRESGQPANFDYSNFGPKWTCDWISYISDNPSRPGADITYSSRGGGTRKFTGFSGGAYAYQLYDQALLKLTSPTSYEMIWRDGTKLVFNQSDGRDNPTNTSRRIFLTHYRDPFGNGLTIDYDGSLRLTSITDAIGQSTTINYGLASDVYKITRVTDPFGRFASFHYDSLGRLTNITDVIGLSSRFTYLTNGDFIDALITPYGTTGFTRGESGNTRWLERLYPDGTRDRVEYNQSSTLGIPFSDPPASVPQGMTTNNQWLYARNTYYWSRNACAAAYGDYSKARVFHWLHTADGASTSGVLESIKEPLEGRVWFSYAGQTPPYFTVGVNNKPINIGRVLDDRTTQLYSQTYDGFGHQTSHIDPTGRKFSYIYSTNGIDLLEVRQTRGTNDELLAKFTYNEQHEVLTATDSAGQTTTNTYNTRGQLLTTANPRGEATVYTYDENGYLVMRDGPLPGTADVSTFAYDSFGRTQTMTDESGYTMTFKYDALDRWTDVTFPDDSFLQRIFDRLDVAAIRDRSGRTTFQEHDAMRQLTKRTDPLSRETRFQWCSCGSLSSLTDPMGRTTTWIRDLQGRLVGKQYGDGSAVSYFYENTISRLKQVIDESQILISFTYNRDDTLRAVAYGNTPVATPAVSYSYDPDYQRIISMTDGTGTTTYSYNPITVVPALGAGQLAAEDGPFSNDTITYGYDELGRRVFTAINGVGSRLTYDRASRVISETNALGAFAYGYDGSLARLTSQSFPNGQTEERSYGSNFQERMLQRITHRIGAAAISEFIYGHDTAAARIASWSQQAGAQSPFLYNFSYDSANQLLFATVTNAGSLINFFGYTYDPAANRLTEEVAGTNYHASYNALNQISTSTTPGTQRTNEWDGDNHLTAIVIENQRVEFTYDGRRRLAAIRKLVNGSEVSYRRFLWCGNTICEERDYFGTVTKRFFGRGMKVETGAAAGKYYYTRDHLGSIREIVDESGNVQARYTYDPYGRRKRLMGDLEADFGFAGMFWAIEANLSITRFRAYDPEIGRWLSRDPLNYAEMTEGPNLYAYVGNDPVNNLDPLGLCMTTVDCTCLRQPAVCSAAGLTAQRAGESVRGVGGAVTEAPQAVTCLQAQVVPTAQTVSGYASGWSTSAVDAFANTVPAAVPQLAQTLPSIAPRVSQAVNLMDKLTPAQQWLYATMNATAEWRTGLPLEQQSQALRSIFETARIVFGVKWIF